MPSSEQIINNAYLYCMSIAQNHYENFPVASKLLHRKLRFHISAVYAFARSADDFADEGDLSRQQRLSLLEEYSTELNHIEHSLSQWENNKEQPFLHSSKKQIFIALADVIQQYQVPMSLFYDLLSAFKQDVVTTRYNNFDDILAYCRLSANPVGRILLYLNNSATEDNLKHSDAICTGLQLINFYQDIAQDMDENNRLYLPLDELQQFAVTEADIKNRLNTPQIQALIKKQLIRTKALYHSGLPLCFNLNARFAIEIRMIYSGGWLILQKLEHNTANIYQRPRLTHKDKLSIILHGLFFKHYYSRSY